MNPNDWQQVQQAATNDMYHEIQHWGPILLMVMASIALVQIAYRAALRIERNEGGVSDEERQEWAKVARAEAARLQEEREAQAAVAAAEAEKTRIAEAEIEKWFQEMDADTPIVTVAAPDAACNDMQEVQHQ